MSPTSATSATPFTAPDDPDCRHRSHLECVKCRRKFCARCGTELAESSYDWKTPGHGYWCPDCLGPAAR